MKRLILLICLMAIVAAGSAFGQAKVGTTGAQFLQLPFSLRSAAMGNVMTTLVDRHAYAGNPGTIGLIAARPEISLGPLMWSELPSPADYYGLGTVLLVKSANVPAGRRTSFGIAAYSTLLKSGPIYETDYYPVPTGRTFRWEDRSYHVRGGVGFSGAVQIGLGAGLTYVRENSTIEDSTASSLSYTTDAWAADIGALIRLPLKLHRSLQDDRATITLTPSAGASLTNIGPDIDVLDNSYSMPQTFRVGLGTEFAVDLPALFQGWKVLSTTAGVEYNRQRDYDGYVKIGAELGLGEALYLRVGHLDEGDGTNTWGFAIGSSGLTRVLLWAFGEPTQLSSTAEFLTSRLTIEYAQSSLTPEGWDSGDILRGFTLTYRYGD